LRGASSPPRPRRSFGRSPCGSSTGWRPEAEGRKAMSHDPAVCLMRWRAMVRRRLELSGVLNGGDDHHDADEWTVSHACYGIATLAADPSGLSLVMHELALSDEQLSRLQAVPLTQCSRADRWRVWESPLAATAEAFAEGITVVQDHLRPEEMPPLPCIPRWIVKAFVYQSICLMEVIGACKGKKPGWKISTMWSSQSRRVAGWCRRVRVVRGGQSRARQVSSPERSRPWR
jgi:hypothetical protein